MRRWTWSTATSDSWETCCSICGTVEGELLHRLPRATPWKANDWRYSQDSFVESYLTNQRSHVFTSVAVLIFVFDISSKEAAIDMLSFGSTIRALHEFSPNSKIFVLVHKMDLVPSHDRSKTFQNRTAEIRSTCEGEGFLGQQVEFWATSIWDQSLYRAWTQVIYFLVPNATVIESMLRKLADLLDARELILYERTTCLVVTHVTRGSEGRNPFHDRFERISSIIKTHKHSMAKHTSTMASETSFSEMQIKTPSFFLFITRLTENTNLLCVTEPEEAIFNGARVNVQLARAEFADLDIVEKKGRDVQRQEPPRDTGLVDHDDKVGEDGDVSSPTHSSDA